MVSPRKPRAKSPSKVGKGAAPQKAPKKNYFSTLMETEEGRELRRQWSTKPRKNGGRPKGVPDGYRKADIDPIRAEAKRRAEKAMKIMADVRNYPVAYGCMAGKDRTGILGQLVLSALGVSQEDMRKLDRYRADLGTIPMVNIT